MLKQRTVLILGAGASVDCGYPTGEQLVEKIRDIKHDGISDTDDDRSTSLEKYYPEFYRQFDGVFTTNIDAYLRDNRSIADIGKVLIAYTMLSHEEPFSPGMDCLREIKQNSSWLLYLFEAVVSGCENTNDILQSLRALTIITFNYDLSVEAFFLSQFLKQERFRADAATLMDNLKVIHIYGSLYGLIDQNENYNLGLYAMCSPRHSKSSSAELLMAARQCARNLHVIGEIKQSQLANEDHIKEAIDLLRSANIIHCFGFGFHADNLALLSGGIEFDWHTKTITFTNKDKTEQIEAAANRFFKNGYVRPIEATAYQAAKEYIAW